MIRRFLRFFLLVKMNLLLPFAALDFLKRAELFYAFKNFLLFPAAASFFRLKLFQKSNTPEEPTLEGVSRAFYFMLRFYNPSSLMKAKLLRGRSVKLRR